MMGFNLLRQQNLLLGHYPKIIYASAGMPMPAMPRFQVWNRLLKKSLHTDPRRFLHMDENDLLGFAYKHNKISPFLQKF